MHVDERGRPELPSNQIYKPKELPPGTFPAGPKVPPIDWNRPMEMPGIDRSVYEPTFSFNDRFIPTYEAWELPHQQRPVNPHERPFKPAPEAPAPHHAPFAHPAPAFAPVVEPVVAGPGFVVDPNWEPHFVEGFGFAPHPLAVPAYHHVQNGVPVGEPVPAFQG